MTRGFVNSRAWDTAPRFWRLQWWGNLAGAAIAAKATGLLWRDSLGLGILMNTRGLVELVILNAALDLGLCSPELFTMMVLMALITTFMTTPILSAMRIGRATARGT